VSEREPTEEELRQALEDQMKRVTVVDVLFQTVATLVNLGGRRLGLARGAEDEKDLDQAHTAIEAVRALVPLLDEERAAPVRDALSQLQMAYARERQGGTPAEGAPAEEPKQPDDAADRAKARSKLWTPPGSGA
jgi:hypothetical protein